jgi:ABC-2 type transporter
MGVHRRCLPGGSGSRHRHDDDAGSIVSERAVAQPAGSDHRNPSARPPGTRPAVTPALALRGLTKRRRPSGVLGRHPGDADCGRTVLFATHYLQEAVAIVFAVGALGGAAMPGWVWVVSGFVAWIAGLVFAAFGLFIGYLMPSENVMQFIGSIPALLAVMAGIFLPLEDLSSALRALAEFTPAYGVGSLARAALLDTGVDGGAIVNVVGCTAVFAAGAVWGFRRDTASDEAVGEGYPEVTGSSTRIRVP